MFVEELREIGMFHRKLVWGFPPWLSEQSTVGVRWRWEGRGDEEAGSFHRTVWQGS